MKRHPLTRREFIKRAVETSAALTVLTPAALASLPSTSPRPLFRFLQVNDTHMFTEPADPKAHYAAANRKAAWVVRNINEEREFPLPDFVIHAGDMVDGGSIERIAHDLASFQSVYKLKCPVYPAVGNHENVQEEGSAEFEASYRQVFGADRTNYTFDHGGIHFIVLNNSGTPMSNGTPVAEARNRWLSEKFAEAAHQPKILCCHIPLVPMRDETVLAKSFGFISYAAQDPALLAIVEAHADSTIAVLSGHLHLTGVVQRKGIYHIVPSGAAGQPCDYGATYEVYANRIDVRMHSLPLELATAYNEGSVRGHCLHGQPRHSVDYVDAAHPTKELYQRGNPDERVFTIPLQGLKRTA